MIKNRFKGLLISSTVLLAFMGTATLNADKVSATPDVVESKTDKKLNEETLNMLLKDIALTQQKVDKLLEEQESKLQEKEKLSNEISNVKVKLDDKQKAMDELKEHTDKLTKELSKVEKELYVTSNDLKKSDEELKKLDTEIEQRKTILSNRLRSVQIKGEEQPTIVKAILTSESIETALTNIINISTIKSAENSMLASLTDLEKEQKETTESILIMENEIKAEKDVLDKRYKDSHSQKLSLEKEKEELIKQETDFKDLITESEEALSDNSDALKEQQEMIDTLQSNISEVVSNLDSIADAEHIAELNRIQSQLMSYSSNTITYRSSSLLDNSDIQQKLLEESEKHLGTPYVWGGTTPTGFDCSGFIQYVYKQALGVSLPRITTQQDDVGQEVALEDIQVGDLIFWGEPSHHVAIYAGNGYYIHAPSTGDVVKYANRPLTGASHIRRVL